MDAILRGPLPSRRRHPHAGEALVAHAFELERRERPDERLLEIAHVALHVLAVLSEVEDRVADELTRPVEGRLSPAIGLGDLDGCVVRDVELALGLRAPADGDHGRVLEKHDGLRDRTLRDGACE